MLWTPQHRFYPWPFDKEAELEGTIAEVKPVLFGEKGKTQNIPDGYMIDLFSPKRPVQCLVETCE